MTRFSSEDIESRLISKSYSMLFSLPKPIVVYAMTILEYIVFLVFLMIIPRDIISVILLSILYWIHHLSMLLILILPQEFHGFTKKRAIGLSVISMFFILIALFLYAFFHSIYVMLFVSIGIGLELLVFIGLTYVSIIILFIIVYIPRLFLACLIFTLALKLNLSVIHFVTNITAGLAILAYVLAIDIITKRNFGFSVLDTFRSYVALTFSGVREKFEKIMEKLSVARELPIGIVVFTSQRNKPKLVIVGAQIHPGPLSFSGSSDFPYNLFNAIHEKFSCPTIFWKGACSHESNLSSLSEQHKVIEAIINEVNNILNSSPTDKIPEPSLINRKNLRIINLNFDDVTFLITSAAPESMDDLDSTLGILAEYIGKVFKKNVLLIDAHNSLSSREKGAVVNADSQTYYHLIDLIITSIKDSMNSKGEIYLGIANEKCDDIDFTDGIGPLGIFSMVLRINNKTWCFITCDSNNILPSFYKEIVSEVKKRFNFDYVEILTTDTHVICAQVSDKAYTILGETKRKQILNHIINAVQKSINNLEKVQVGSKLIKIRCKVLGYTGEKLLKTYAISSAINFMVNFASILGLAILLHSLLLLLL